MLLKFFRGRSIRFKLLVYFLLLILLPIAILGILGNVIYSGSIESEINSHTIQMIGQVKENVEFYIRDMENIIRYLSREPAVNRLLRLNSSLDADRVILETEVRRILNSFSEIHPEVAGILVVNKNDIYISNEMFRITRDSLVIESWYKQAVAHPEEVQLISKPIGRNITTKFNYGADDVVSIVKAVKDPGTGEYNGVILIDMKLETIERIIKGITLGKNGFLYIMDSNGDIVYAPINKIVYRVKSEWLAGKKSKSVIRQIGHNRYQIMYSDSGYTKWKTVGVFSLNETLKEIANIRYYTIIICCITLIIAISAALVFTASIAKPVGKLKKLMKQAESGDLNVYFNSIYNDEIGQLGNSFNNMIAEIRKLINMVYVEQKSKREAELKILQAQIKPHFLYNTLDTIQWMAQDHDANDIVEIVAALTSLFRIGLSKGKELLKVSEELEHVKSYLIIQKARYEDKFEYEINFDEEIMEYYVLKLILQPLVENAIYHGIKAKRGKGKIIISAGKTGDKLHFSVADDGVGISQERIAELNKMLEGHKAEDENPGYGVYNINERIRLSYGSGYGLNFLSVYGEGTTVEVWHPIIER